MNQEQLKELFNSAELGFKVKVNDVEIKHYRLITKFKDASVGASMMFVMDFLVEEDDLSFFCENYEVCYFPKSMVEGRIYINKWSGTHHNNVLIPLTEV